ncbi:DUF6531 domain-containing protein, partial [Rathayibacter tritici]|uniref:DUF6531 domain-containing protein n=2 Tax=Rathayibacter tritici TaxID=33888 RepID=UPI000CE7738F
MHLGAIEEDVPFDDGAAEALISAFDAAASMLVGQAGSRSSLVTTALAEFRGRFAQVFESNARVAASDVQELAQRLREVSSGARQLRREAHKEQKRRQIAREWQREQDARNLLERAGDALFGSDDPPVGPAADEPRIPVESASTGAREVPALSGGGTGGGTSAARPDDLRTFATSASALDDELGTATAVLRGRLADFAERCRWGALSADGVVSGAEQWLAANRQDAAWARTVADAFAAAGGEGVVSNVADSALAVALASAGIPADRRDLTITPAQAFGAPPSTGYSDDPVNTATGNFLEVERDLTFDGGCATLLLERSYNSLDERIGAFGRGWSSIVEQRLRLGDEGAVWVMPDGREVIFPREGAGWARAVGENCWLEARDGLLVVSDSRGTTVEFSASGRWRAHDSGPGTGITAEYVDERLVRLRHARGRCIDLEWSGDLVVAALASDGRRAEYRYDEDRLASVSLAAGIRRYSWNDAGLIESVTAASGVVEVVNEYDSRRRVRSQRSPFGRATRYAYLSGRASVVSDLDGSRSNTWVADAAGRLVGVLDSEGRRQSMSYDAHGNLLSVVERDGAVTAHAYDERGRRVRTRTPSGADVRLSYDDRDRVVAVSTGDSVTSYEYGSDEAREPVLIVDPEGGRTALTWSDGLLTQVVDPVGVMLRMTHDEYGDLVATTNADGRTARLERDETGRVTAAVSPSGARTSFRYDPAGQLISRRDAGGSTWQYERDTVGRLVATVDPLGGRTELTYGEHGETTRTIDPLGRSISREFDDLGNVAAAILPDGAAWRFAYDAVTRLVATTDPAGGVWRREYDATGALTATIDPTGVRRSFVIQATCIALGDGPTHSRVRFDPLGRPIAEEGPDDSESRTSYDRCGRPVELVDAEGGSTALHRDAAGRVVEQVSPTGASTSLEYDACGRLSGIVDPVGGRTRLEYDADGRMVRRVDPAGGVTTVEYDAIGRVVLRRVPGEGTSRYRYDAAGRLIGTRDSRYGVRRFRYDAAGQLVEAVNGVGGVTRYDYDQRGRLVTIVDPAGGVTRREYDAADREVATVDPLGRRTTGGYDAAGRWAWQETPDGHRWDWRFDAFGREKSGHIDGVLHCEIDRDPHHRRLTITDHTASEPVVHTLEWDRAGRLLHRRRDGDGLAWEYNADGTRSATIGPEGAATRYERDLAGRITAIEHPLVGRAEFSYDAAGRIASSSAGGGRQTWQYRDGFLVEHVEGGRVTALDRDGEGRLSRVRSGDGTVEYRYDQACQLVEASGDVVSSWAYDACGRPIAESTAGRMSSRSYDIAGQLRTMTDADGTVTEYQYDGLGRRTGALGSDGSARSFAWSRSGRLESIEDRRADGSTSVVSLHVDALGELARVGSTELRWDSADAVPSLHSVGPLPVLATPGGVTGIGERWVSAGWRAQRPTLPTNPWDLPATEDSTLPSELSLAAGGGVAVAGLEWLGHRVYDPATRGFLSTDPLEPVVGSGWSGNPYSYAGNDPLHALDPLGLRPVTDAELRAYRDGNNGAFADVGRFVVDANRWAWENKEYLLAGVAVLAGIALMCTGVGGPVGLALMAGAGALVSGGVSVATQKAGTGSVDWGRVGID